jgi:hypothetical protein
MACYGAVASLKGKTKSDLLEARVAELERMVKEIHSRVMGCAVASGVGRSNVPSKTSRGTKVVPRVYSGAKAGGVLEGEAVQLPGLLATPSLKPGWTVVPHGRGAAVRTNRGEGRAKAVPIPVRNSFAVLSEDCPETHVSKDVCAPPVPRDAASVASRGGRAGILLIGSSNVRRIAPSLRKRARSDGADQRVTSWCIPGGLVPNTTAAIRAATGNSGCSSLRVVAHVGTNDASQRGTDEILNSFRDLNSEVERARKASGVDMRLSICSIVPRMDCGLPVWNRIDCLNRRLWKFCVSIGAEFVDLRPVLGSCRAPLNRSGVHYTAQASERVAHRIFEHCRYFLG